MANHRVPMHLLRQILLLKQQGKSIRDIARSLAIARNTIRGYLRLLPQTDLTGLLGQTDAQLDQLIQPPVATPLADSRLAELQKRLPAIDRQLACTGVTRYDLWIDYRGQQPNGYQYTAPAARLVLSPLSAMAPNSTGDYALRA